MGSKPFLAGEKPNLGDLAVYACIRAIEGMDAHKVSRDEQALKVACRSFSSHDVTGLPDATLPLWIICVCDRIF